MKKIAVSLLLIALVLSLAGCAGLAQKAVDKQAAAEAAAEATPVPTASPDPSAVMEASDTDTAAAQQTHTPPASATDAQVDLTAYDQAVACIGRPVQELYTAVGNPIEEPAYGPSCLQEDAEDGMLTYNGFFVWTIRTESGETVQEVYLDE